jgi:hypothetical protein
VLKLLFRSQSSQAVREIAGGPVKRWLDKELPAIRNTRADLIGETFGGDIVHLEFMSENQKFFELRMAGYYVEIYRACGRHPRQALVYVGRGKLRMSGHFRSLTLSFRFRVVDLRELNGGRFLASDAVGDQILSVLMRLKNRREAIRRILATIATLDTRAREDALGPVDGNLWIKRNRDGSRRGDQESAGFEQSARSQGSGPRIQEGHGTRAPRAKQEAKRNCYAVFWNIVLGTCRSGWMTN